VLQDIDVIEGQAVKLFTDAALIACLDGEYRGCGPFLAA
jgi:hypothetical protein